MKNNKNKIIIIGHKGGAFHQAPDNTLKAYKKAIECGGDYIEIDIRRSKDGILVLRHDSDTFRTTGIHGLVEEMTLKELKMLDCGEGEKIPTLMETINLVKSKINLMCELKTPNLTKDLIKILKRENILESTIFVSFFIEELLKIQKTMPNLIIGAIITEEFLPEWSQKKELIDIIIENKFDYILARFKNVDSQFIDYCHKNDLKVIVYPIKTKIIMKRYLNLGVDGIMVKNISKIKELLNE